MQKDTMAPKITYDGKYVALTEYNSEYEAIKVCEAQSGRIVCTIPVSTLSLKVAALGMPPKGKFLINKQVNPAFTLRGNPDHAPPAPRVLIMQNQT